MVSRVVTVLGRANSLNVRKVMWCAAELGLTVTREDFGRGTQPTDTDGFRALNPHQKVPVLRHAGLVLWESNTIVRYLCAVFGTRAHLPTAPAARAECEKWMDWQLGTLQVAMAPLFHGRCVAPGSVEPKDLARAECEATALMERLDAAITGDFLCGPLPGAADFSIGPSVHRYLKLVAEPPSLPQLQAYYARLTQRPAYSAHVGFAAP